jgi:hypothetical protein
MDAINPQSHYPLLKYSIKLIQKKEEQMLRVDKEVQ